MSPSRFIPIPRSSQPSRPSPAMNLMFITLSLFTVSQLINITHMEGFASDFSDMVLEIISNGEASHPDYQIVDMQEGQWVLVNVSVPEGGYDLNVLSDVDGQFTSNTDPSILEISWQQGLAYDFSNLAIQFVAPDGTTSDVLYTIISISEGEWAIIALERAPADGETITIMTTASLGTYAPGEEQPDEQTDVAPEPEDVPQDEPAENVAEPPPETFGPDVLTGPNETHLPPEDVPGFCQLTGLEASKCAQEGKVLKLKDLADKEIPSGLLKLREHGKAGGPFFSNLTNVLFTNLTIDGEGGSITYPELRVSVQKADLSEAFIVAQNLLGIDTAAYPQFDASAHLEFRGLNHLRQPYPLRNGKPCVSECSNFIYDPATGTASMDVSGFSNYSIGEINVSYVEHLDSSYGLISDITGYVKDKDDNWSEQIPLGDFVRATFEQNLTNGSVVDVYTRKGGADNVYFNIYANGTTSPLLGTSGLLNDSGGWSYITLENLSADTDTFDFEILGDSGGYAEFDYIHDVSACTNISYPGTYTLTQNVAGAPYPASSAYYYAVPPATLYSCILISSSDVVFDCNGYNITYSGANTPSAGIMVNGTDADGNSTLAYHNITIKNCPRIYGYNIGVDIESAENVTIQNTTSMKNTEIGFLSYGGFFIHGSKRINITNCTAANNTQYGYLVSAYSDYNTFQDDVAYGQDGDSSLDYGHGFVVYYGNGNNLDASFTNCSSYNNNVSGFYLADNNISLINSSSYNNHADGVYIAGSSGRFYGNRVHGNGNTATGYGFVTAGGAPADYNVFENNTVYNNSISGFIITRQYNNLTNNTIYDNGWRGGLATTPWAGIELNGAYASSTTIRENTIHNNTAGICVINANRSLIFNNTLYNNGWDVYVVGAYGTVLNITNATFRNPSGTLENYTVLDINDTLSGSGQEYTINWTFNSSSIPSGYVSFTQKFVNISTVSGTPSIDRITWHWTVDELGSTYDESKFELWKYNSTGWTMLNGTPDTVTHTFTLFDMEPASDYIILENQNCPILSESGAYLQDNDYVGATNAISGVPPLTAACVMIASSDVLFDCNGYSITNNGTADAIGVFINGSSAVTYTNITVKNCPSISGYGVGIAAVNASGGSLIQNNTVYNSSYHGFFLNISKDVWLNNNTAYDNLQYALAITFSSYINLTNNVWHSSQSGIVLAAASYLIAANETVYNSTNASISAIWLSTASTGNSFTNVTIRDNAGHGVHLQNVNNNNFTSCTIYNNSNYGFYSFKGNSSRLVDSTLYGNKYSLVANRSTGANVTLYLTNVLFKDGAGSAQNFTNLSLTDLLEVPSEAYAINWTSNESALPTDYLSFEQKFLNISNLTAGVSIDSIVWYWTDADVALESYYDDSKFELWKYNMSGEWEMINSTPDTSANTLSLTGMNPASDYGILQNNVTENCLLIDTPGAYQLSADATGAPFSAAPTLSKACIVVASPDVSLDCNGHTITNNGTDNSYGIFVNASANSNVTVKNCQIKNNYTYGVGVFGTSSNPAGNVTIQDIDVIESYYYAFYAFRAVNVTIDGSNAYNNSVAGFYLNEVNDSMLYNNSAYNISNTRFLDSYGIYMLNSNLNTVVENTATICGYGIYVEGGGNNNLTANLASQSDDGFRIISSPYNNLTSNNATNCSSNGFYMLGSDYTNVISNIAYNNTGLIAIGFDFDVSNHTNVINNTATRNYQGGMAYSLKSHNFSIVNNTITNNGGSVTTVAGLYILGVSYNFSVIGNNISDNFADGLQVTASHDGYIADNIASNNNGTSGAGFRLLTGTQAGNHTLVNNTACGNAAGFVIGGPLSSGPISNITFINNTACGNGAGFDTDGAPPPNKDIILVTLTNNTAYDNINGFSMNNWAQYFVFTNNTAHDNSNAGIASPPTSNLTGNLAYNNGYYGIQGELGCLIVNNSAFNNGLYGFVMSQSTMENNTAYNNSDGVLIGSNSVILNLSGFNNTEYGINIGGSDNISVTDATLTGNGDGIHVSSYAGAGYMPVNITFTNITAANNSGNGMHLDNASAAFIDPIFFNNSQGDVYASADGTGAVTLNMTRALFLNPAGTLQNYTNLSINDSLGASNAEIYSINWTRNSSALPAGYPSFAQKFVNITNGSSTVSIDSIVWSWTGDEVTAGGYNESKFQLWKYNGTWTMLNGTPDTTNHELSLTGMNPASDYGILENDNCPVITSSGTYIQGADYVGAPNNATELGAGGKVCVKITASDVIYDCNGYSINNFGTVNATAIFVNGSAASPYHNVTIQNCPRIWNYSVGTTGTGVYLYHADYSSVTNVTVYSNSATSFQSGFTLADSTFNTLLNDTSLTIGSGGRGLFLIRSNSNNMTNCMVNGTLISLSSSSNNNTISGLLITDIASASNAISIGTSNGTTITNSTFSNPTTIPYALYLDTANNTIFSGNNIYRGLIYLRYSTNNTIANNSIDGSGTTASNYSITLTTQTNGTIVTNNTIFNWPNRAIHVQTAYNTTLANNSIYNTSGDAIYLYGDATINYSINLTANRLFSNGGYGLRIQGFNGVTMADNIMYNNSCDLDVNKSYSGVFVLDMSNSIF
ncbi:MAG: right-handed parallel beta-helix repeat-containing protein, partial [Candidatus ainarchaeum sp.]|nr:right-handed parallel beta-helix repeat-containing protein [Candidatus ainarchaeum sp.]